MKFRWLGLGAEEVVVYGIEEAERGCKILLDDGGRAYEL